MLAFACATGLYAAPESRMERVEVVPAEGALLELKAEMVDPDAPRVFAPGICVWNGQLWYSALTSPPLRILTAGTITIDGDAVALDVSGLAEPWGDVTHFTDSCCYLVKHCLGEDGREVYYELRVWFARGGAEDYVVTWLIYKGQSIRESIRSTGDSGPDWLPLVPDEDSIMPADDEAAVQTDS